MIETPQRILITGASSGIGAALAKAYARPGRDLLLMGRDGERLRQVALACTNKGATAGYVCADIRDAALVHQWIVDQDRRQPIDLVIANAGISAGTFETKGAESATQIQAIVDVNIQGVFNAINPLIPRMVERRRGQVALVSSLAAFVPWPGAPAYAASKAAVKTYGQALRIALYEQGVHVSVICPGFVKTPMTDVNPYPMPFLQDVDRAADKIIRGLASDRAVIAFPWQLAILAWLGGLLPSFLQRKILAQAPSKPALISAVKGS